MHRSYTVLLALAALVAVGCGGEGDDAPGTPMQVTYAGWPLYHFSGDEAPGDTNGQGVNDVWFVVDPAGEPPMAAATTARDDTGY